MLKTLLAFFDEKRFEGKIKQGFTYKNGEYMPDDLFHLMKLSNNYESGGDEGYYE